MSKKSRQQKTCKELDQNILPRRVCSPSGLATLFPTFVQHLEQNFCISEVVAALHRSPTFSLWVAFLWAFLLDLILLFEAGEPPMPDWFASAAKAAQSHRLRYASNYRDQPFNPSAYPPPS